MVFDAFRTFFGWWLWLLFGIEANSKSQKENKTGRAGWPAQPVRPVGLPGTACQDGLDEPALPSRPGQARPSELATPAGRRWPYLLLGGSTFRMGFDGGSEIFRAFSDLLDFVQLAHFLAGWSGQPRRRPAGPAPLAGRLGRSWDCAVKG